MNKEMMLVESRTMRDNYVYRDDVLEKVKAISLIGEKLEVTLEMAAAYYGVSPDLCGFTTLRAGTFPNIALGTICL